MSFATSTVAFGSPATVLIAIPVFVSAAFPSTGDDAFASMSPIVPAVCSVLFFADESRFPTVLAAFVPSDFMPLRMSLIVMLFEWI